MDKYFTYQGIRLHYTLRGAGQPLFLLHGWGCDGKIWERISAFLEQHFQLYTFDFAGFGLSEEPKQVWGVEEYTRSIEAIAQSEGVSNPILIGHSFGGRVAIVFASRNKTHKIILTDAAGVKPKRGFTYYRKVYTFKLLKRLAPIFLGRERAEKLIAKRRAKAGSSDYNNASPMMRQGRMGCAGTSAGGARRLSSSSFFCSSESWITSAIGMGPRGRGSGGR